MNWFRPGLLIVLTALIPACSPSATTSSAKTEKESGTVAKLDPNASATSDDVLTSAVHQLQPENFGLNSATDKPVSLLNSWRFKQIEANLLKDEAVTVAAPEGWVKPEEQPRLTQSKFDAADAVHIRDALFHRALSGYLSDRGKDELQRVAIIVDFVCRNVALWKDDEIELPLNPFMTMQLGRGTPDDRAWVISETLRQLRIDSVVITPKSDVKASGDKWLLGVPVEGSVYLFDVKLGLPIPKAVSGDRVIPATLTEVVEHPELLQQMAATEAYRITAEDLTNPNIFVTSSPNFWSRRMHFLEQVLPPSDACVIYDPLSDEDGRTGLLKRISDVGKWPVEELKLWPYPHLQLAEARRASPERDQELQRLTAPFSVPIPFKADAQGKVTFLVPERKLQRCRTDHLLGKFAEATTKYLRIRHLDVEASPPEIERLNRMAAEDSLYWTTLCKYELGEYATSIDLLNDYLRKYDRKGKWFFPARVLLAQCFANQGRTADAISTLERTSSDDPYRMANAIRVKQWSKMKAQ